MSSKGLKIIQTVHPGGSTRSAVKHLVPGHAVLAAVQREDVVAATLLLPNPATNNPVHVHAYRYTHSSLYLYTTHIYYILMRVGDLFLLLMRRFRSLYDDGDFE